MKLSVVVLWLSISTLALFIEGVQCHSQSDNYYNTLGVDGHTSTAGIKKAYKKLAKKYHPDVNPGDEEINKKYESIKRAHEVLTHDEKRQVYDHGGFDDLEKYENGQYRQRRGPNARADIQVTLEEMYKGTQRGVNINRNVYCPQCNGTGAKDGKLKKCPKCKGQGQVLQMVQVGFGMQMQMQTECPKCQGKGKTMAARCDHCSGKRVVNDDKHIAFKVERGMKNGEQIRMEREAEQVPDMNKGDLVFTLKQKKHKTFTRVGDNLYVQIPLSLEESLLGFETSIVHLDGRTIRINQLDKVIQPGQQIIIKGEGMPIRHTYNSFGDLIVKCNVKFPDKLTKEQQELLQHVFPELKE